MTAPALNVLFTVMIIFKDVHETFKQKKCPVLEDEAT